MSTHTPGPWVITERKGHPCFGKDSVECLIHAGSHDPQIGHGNAFASVELGASGAISSKPEDVRANARLIAAAPELLDALEDALIALCADEFDVADLEETIRKAENSIRKAKGEPSPSVTSLGLQSSGSK